MPHMMHIRMAVLTRNDHCVLQREATGNAILLLTALDATDEYAKEIPPSHFSDLIRTLMMCYVV